MLTESYRTDAGRELRVRVTCVDSGGHHQHQVLSYCGLRRSRGVLAIKGVAGPRPIWPARSSRTRTNAQIFMIGVDTGKDVVYGRLRIPKPGPGYIHFPIGGAFDAEYFAQLTSEAVQTRFKEGRPYRVWVLPDGRRNEALDTTVYALAARHATRVRLDLLPRPARAEPAARSAGRWATGLSAGHAATSTIAATSAPRSRHRPQPVSDGRVTSFLGHR